ncbi:hypothetical protein Angca_005554 [Angiostrongylus cantonensis]|nr:hypothetical protein Angca_005554 [Angiostrongylus cantonensis]
MKLLASVALLGLALASTFIWDPRPQISEEWFETDREYRYLFDGQITTGMDLPNTQQSATRLQAMVSLQPVDDRTVVFKLTQIRFGSIMEEFEARQLLPFERFQLVKLNEQDKNMLTLPIRFAYRNGLVSDIEFSEEDKPWSANIKKAVLNMLQINRPKRDELKKNERDDKNQDYFVATERTLEGECEVEYTINDMSADKKQWTKSINFQKCNMRPEVQYGVRNRNTKKRDEKLYSTVVKHKVSENKDKFLIHEAELRSQYKLVPLCEKHEMIASVVYNKITLVYAGKMETQIPNMRRDRKESLIYNSETELAEEKFAMTGDERYLQHVPEWNNKVEHIEKLLSTIIRNFEEKIDPETTHLFARLVKLLRLCREWELTKIQRFLENHEKVNQKVLSLYYDALAMAGTKVTVTELVKLIISEKIDSLKAARLIKAMAEIRVPSEKIAEQVLSVCESQIAEKTPYLKQACWLTYGAIFNGLCRNDKLASYHVDNLCKRELKEKVVGKLMNLFEKSDNRYEKVLMLKSLANAGIDISAYALDKIIYNKDEEKTIRIEAMNALRKLGVIMPRKVQNILMPIFKDRTECAEVRMAALRRIMNAKPEQVVMDQIVHQMENERDQNLRSFIYGVLKSVSEFPENDEKTVISVKKALRAVDTEFYEKLNNRVSRWTVKGDEMKYGTTLNLQTLFTKDSALPKDFLASLDTIFGGEWYKYFGELGFSQQNVDEVMSKFLHKFEDANMERFVVRGKRSVTSRTSDFFKAIYKKLNFVRRHHSNKEDPHAMLYVRYMDNDYALLLIDEDSIPKFFKDIVRDGKVQLGDIERTLATGFQFQNAAGFFFYEFMKKIPTSLGLPLMLTYKMPTVATVQGHIKIDLEPKGSADFNGIRAHLLLKPKVASTHVVRAVAFCPVVESGFKMLHSVNFDHPVDAEVKVALKHQLRLNIVFHPHERKRNVIHIQSRPVSFIRHLKKTTHAYPEPNEVTVHLLKQLYPVENFEYSFFRKYGSLLKVVGTTHIPLVSRTEGLLNPLIVGYNTLDVFMEPTQDVAKEYVLSMELETFVPETIEKPTLEKFFKNNDEFFELDADDFEPKRNGDRRSLVSTYLRNFDNEKGYKHRLFFKFETVGQRNKNEMEMELEAVCDNKYRLCRTRLLAHSTPQEMENRKWEMNVEVQTVYPETPKSLSELKEQVNREFYGFIDASWGSNKMNNVFIRIQGEQSREQKVWMKNLGRAFENKLTEMEKVKLASNLNLYKWTVKYELTPETEYRMSNLFSLLKNWQKWDTEYEMVNNQERLLRAQLNIEPVNRRTFDLFLNTPQNRIVIKRGALPMKLPTINIHNSNAIEFAGIKDVISHVVKQNRAECVIKSENVNTFDNLPFKTSFTTCYTVLAKDCSNEEPKFVVLMKKLQKNGNDKKLKLINRENIYEIEMRGNELACKVNGREITHNQMEQYGLNKIHENLYEIDIGDVSVTFDGFQANIKLSPLYMNKQCGLCGHYDGEKWNDLRRADNEETDAIQDFHRSYITKDDECDYEESELEKDNQELEMDLKNRNYRGREEKELNDDDVYSFDESDDEKDTRKPIHRTRVIEREHRVCFSAEPVLDCPKYTRKTEVTEEEVDFVCVRSSNQESRRLLRKARDEIIPRALLKGQNWSTTVPIPKSCVVY